MMDAGKLIVKRSRIGRGVFAGRDIKKGELVFLLEGTKYHYNRPPFITENKIRNRAIQTGPDTWLYSDKCVAWIANHSCNPNIGIKGRRRYAAMRDINEGEELTWDYSTTEDADWTWKCRCQAENCRKTIGPWRNLPLRVKKKYRNWTSSWILKRNKL